MKFTVLRLISRFRFCIIVGNIFCSNGLDIVVLAFNRWGISLRLYVVGLQLMNVVFLHMNFKLRFVVLIAKDFKLQFIVFNR